MLFDIEGNTQTSIPRRPFYDQCRSNLTDLDHEGIMAEVHRIMNQAIEDGAQRGEVGIFNSSYVAGADWTDTPFQPIYEACGQDEDVAKLFYGLLVWEAVMCHDDDWVFHRMESTSDRPLGMSYFQKVD